MCMAGGDTAEVDRRAVTAELADATNVLLLAPSMSDAGAGACLDLFAPEPLESAGVIGVTYTRSPDAWMETWRERVGGPPADLVVVSVGGGRRSAAEAPAGEVGAVDDVPVRSIESPEDLTGLGIALGEQFEAWGDDLPAVLCYDSLTVLLQFVDLQRAFRFLHVLTGRVAAADGQAHYHLDPTAVDRQTVATLRSLFDTIVRWEDGEWVVQSR